MAFVFDTNSIRVLGNYYPEQFPSFWSRFEDEIDAGRVLSVREVFNELERLDKVSWLSSWAKERKTAFVLASSAETNFVGEVFQVPHFRNLVGLRQQLLGQPVADPFVIAAARVRGFCVVTEEANKKNAAKIPNVCAHFGIDCTNVEGFLQRLHWRF